MSAKAADLLLALNSQVKHEDPEEANPKNKSNPSNSNKKKALSSNNTQSLEIIQETTREEVPNRESAFK